jgi:hypothetical protein
MKPETVVDIRSPPFRSAGIAGLGLWARGCHARAPAATEFRSRHPSGHRPSLDDQHPEEQPGRGKRDLVLSTGGLTGPVNIG